MLIKEGVQLRYSEAFVEHYLKGILIMQLRSICIHFNGLAEPKAFQTFSLGRPGVYPFDYR